MANHIRQQIRERAGTVLTGLTTTGSNVFETSEPIVISTNRLMSRELELIVEVYVKQTSNFDDEVDKICKEVEVAISADTTLNGLAKDCFLQSTEIEYNTEGEQPLSYAVLTFLTNYYVQETAPDVAV
jgi:hypothetical protein